jgi:glucose dehydrogenase
VCFCACGGSRSQQSAGKSAAQETNYSSPAYHGKLEADDGQWVRPAKDYASTRYSSLDQINTSNAKNLKVAFTFSTGQDRGHEAAPIVVNNTMYIVTPWPNELYALDLTKPGALYPAGTCTPPRSRAAACMDSQCWVQIPPRHLQAHRRSLARATIPWWERQSVA